MRRFLGSVGRVSALLVLGVFGVIGTGCGGPKMQLVEWVPPPKLDDTARARCEPAPLHLEISSTPTAVEAKDVVAKVTRALLAKLGDQGFVADRTTPDVLIVMTVMTGLPSRSRVRTMYRGSLDAQVTCTHRNVRLGRKEVSARGESDKGQDEALTSLADKLLADLLPWVSGLTDAGKLGLVAETITISRDWQNFSVDSRGFARTFTADVEHLDGVAACHLAGKNLLAKQLIFRVVYYKDRFPQGIMKSIAAIEELNVQVVDQP